MMIEVNNLSKRYLISRERDTYLTVAEELSGIIRNPFAFVGNKIKEGRAKQAFWALDNISFSVEGGQAIGLIGANGAGKSTLLKIISRITPPTRGTIKLEGKISSLLEIGTGFHQELTGRENVFLNGAILGMTRKEMLKKFDEIVAFAGIEKFLETPIKRYSSGMGLRLAFAIAAFLEPEILAVDEVLAVGDAEFQKRSLNKMDEVVKKAGRTILFVSHNLAAVSKLCQQALVLEKGRIIFFGNVDEAIRIYMKNFLEKQTEWRGEIGDENAKLVHAWVRSLDPKGYFHTASDVEIGVELEVARSINNLILGFVLFSELGHELAYSLYDDAENSEPETIQPGRLVKKFIIPANTLAQGTYRIEFEVGIHMIKWIAKQGLTFSLENISGLGRRFHLRNIKKVRERERISIFRPPWAVN